MYGRRPVPQGRSRTIAKAQSETTDSSGATQDAGKGRSLWHPLNVGVVVAGMFGWRLDRSRWEALGGLVGIALSFVVTFLLTDMTVGNIVGTSAHRTVLVASIVYLVVTWSTYYVGHTLFYMLGVHRWMRRRFGAEKAFSIYSTVLGIVYFNIFWCNFPLLAAFQYTLGINAWPIVWGGLLLLAGGSFIKFWATLHLGLQGYYYRDMFLEEQNTNGPIVDGPYAFLSDPMYSVGYFPMYGGALLAMSLEGIVAAMIFHASIYLFNLIVERPFVLKTYGSPLESIATRAPGSPPRS